MKKLVTLGMLLGMLAAAPIVRAGDTTTAGDPGSAAPAPKHHHHKAVKKSASPSKSPATASSEGK